MSGPGEVTTRRDRGGALGRLDGDGPGTAGVRIHLLGGARLSGPNPIPRLERKTAAMLAFLATEGATPRSRLAGLLWPESRERTARNNLVQAIRRLRAAAGLELVVGDEVVELRGATDVADLELLVHQGEHAKAVALRGELLAGYDFDDCRELDAWLRGARARATQVWARAVTSECERCEREGAIDDAIALAEQLVAVDPLSESSHLRVARLWLKRGDAPAAMRAYERCKRTLERELGMRPSEAMLDVLRAIRAGRPDDARRSGEAALPAAVLHPQWVGRKREWAELEAAYAARRGALVFGEPGVGKSRLVREFSSSRGPVATFEGRPGDPHVPFASLARGLRAALSTRKIALAPWVARELSRVVPELGDPEAAPSPLRDKLLFVDAVARAFEAMASANVRTVVVDDLQWIDPASAEAMAWAIERCWAGEIPLFVVVAHRDGELSSEVAARIDRAQEAGIVSRIPLGPLDVKEASALLDSLELPALADRAQAIVQASHGHPLFLLEIVRALIGTSPSVGADVVPLPERVKTLVRRRLDRLSSDALRLARVAAIAGPEFDLALAAHVLGTSPLDLTDSWSELERAQVFSKGTFTHDVLAEAVRDGLPAVVREHVHARTAEHLIHLGRDPARVAHHLIAGRREADAVPYLMRAAQNARNLSRIADAFQLYDRASRILEEAGDASGACAVLYQQGRFALGMVDDDDVVRRLERLAQTPHDRARALCTRANLELARGNLEHAGKVAAESYPLAAQAGDLLVEAEAIQAKLEAELRTGKLDDAERTLLLFEDRCRALGDPEAITAAIASQGELLALRDRHREALARFEEVLSILERWGKLGFAKARVRALMALSCLALGDVADAERRLEGTEQTLAQSTGAIFTEALWRLARGRIALARRAFGAAVEAFDLASKKGTPISVLYPARVERAKVRVLVGELNEADAELTRVARDTRADARVRAEALVTRARIAVARGRAPNAAHARFVEAWGAPSQIAMFAALRAVGADPARSEGLLAAADDVVRRLDVPALRAAVDVCRAEAAWRARKSQPAFEAATRARAAVDAGELHDLDAERALVLFALTHPPGPGKAEAIRRASAHVTAPIGRELPPSARDAYVSSHLLRERIVSLARARLDDEAPPSSRSHRP